MALKRFKFNLMFILDINDITSQTVDRELRRFGNYEEIKNEQYLYDEAARERRLLHALINDKDELRDFAKRYFADCLEEADYQVREYLGFDNFLCEAKQLALTIKKLSQEDQDFFNETIEREIFLDRVDHFHNSLKLRLADVTITETD